MTDANVNGAHASAPAKAKKATGAKAVKKVSNHPKYVEMVKSALATLKEKHGSSRHAILKYIMQNYKLDFDEKTINTHLKKSLRSGLKTGLLKQSKGSGAAGSFKLNDAKAVSNKSPKKKSPSKSPAKKAAAPAKAHKPVSPKKKAVASKPKKVVAAAKPKTASPVKKAVTKKTVVKPKASSVKKVASPKKAKPTSPKISKSSPKKPKAAAKGKKTKK